FTNANGAFRGADPVQAQVLDGATLDDPGPPVTPGPDFFHIDNANMETDRDGIPPTMQMYLFHFLGLPWSDPGNGLFDPFLAANGGDEADIVYHEYTHGLSNRLVVDSNGNSTLISTQANSMGEAWSDWYAMDFLASSACDGSPCF